MPIFDPLLFIYLFIHLFIYDLFLFIQRTNICNFADDNTIYSCQNDLKTILEDLRYDMVTSLRLFKENSVKINPTKISIYDSWYIAKTTYHAQYKPNKGRRISKKVLLGLTVDNRLPFQDHADMSYC